MSRFVCGRWGASNNGLLSRGWFRSLLALIKNDPDLIAPCGPWEEFGVHDGGKKVAATTLAVLRRLISERDDLIHDNARLMDVASALANETPMEVIEAARREGAEAARAAMEADGWHPIATAPLDGTPVDLWSRLGAFYSDRVERQPGMWFVPSLQEWRNDSGDKRIHAKHPTHWRPIPAGPKEEARNA